MKQTIRIGKQYIRTDFGLILILLLLMATSSFALFNAFNLIKNASGYYYLQRQLMWYAVSFGVMFAITYFQNNVLFKYLGKFYNLLMLVLVYMLLSKAFHSITGHPLPMASAINGAYSWLQIPLLGSFQASEFIKIILIIKVSQIIVQFQNKYPNPTFKDDLRMFVQIGIWALPPMILILAQPDTGVFIIIALTLLIIIMCSGIKKGYIITLAGLIVLVVAILFYFYFFNRAVLSTVVSGYQLSRIDAWLNPEDHILGSSNQLYTSLLSLGSAGLTGHGLQANIISIPEAHTDFIFAAFGQCFGLAGTVYILFVCLLLDLYLCRMAYNVTNRTDKLIIIGTIGMLFYQQFQNLGMIVGLLPITGITLPLISYGGSSTLSYFILFGVILNLSPAAKTSYKVQIPELGIDEHFRFGRFSNPLKGFKNPFAGLGTKLNIQFKMPKKQEPVVEEQPVSSDEKPQRKFLTDNYEVSHDNG